LVFFWVWGKTLRNDEKFIFEKEFKMINNRSKIINFLLLLLLASGLFAVVPVGLYGGGNGSGDDAWVSSADMALPVVLAYYKAEIRNGAIELNWRTESELNNLGFVVQRRKNNGTWIGLSSYQNNDALVGSGTTTQTHTYQFIDDSVEPGAVYEYRLGDVDYDNNLTWKQSIEITADAENASLLNSFGLQEIYPNPFNPSVTISYGLSTESQVSLQIYSLSGQLMQTLLNSTMSAGDHSLMWNPINISTGVYLVQLQANNEVQTQKIVYLK
jgi:hypothetical protein